MITGPANTKPALSKKALCNLHYTFLNIFCVTLLRLKNGIMIVIKSIKNNID